MPESTILFDIWGNEITLTPKTIQHRQRAIKVTSIETVCVKNRRLLINSYKENSTHPTMCMFFETPEDAIHAMRSVVDVMAYKPQSQKSGCLSRTWKWLNNLF